MLWSPYIFLGQLLEGSTHAQGQQCRTFLRLTMGGWRAAHPWESMWLCIIPRAGPQEIAPEPHTGTCLGPRELVGGSLPGLGVAGRWGNSACGQLQDAMPWAGGLTRAPAWGQRLLMGFPGTGSGSLLRVGSSPRRWERRPGPEEAAPDLRPGVPGRARAWRESSWGTASPGSQGKQPPPHPTPNASCRR